MSSKKDLTILQRQFLCCYPLNLIDCSSLSFLDWEGQKQLVDLTYNNELNRKYPISSSYQLRFFKKLITQLELAAVEVHDEIYEAFCKLNSAGSDDEKFSYKHYSLPHQNTIFTLKESKSFVADGTTGLCSWQASLALADWLLHNPEVVREQTIIELGCGTGLCGFIVSKCCKAKKVILTDGSPKVIDILQINRSLNFDEKAETAVEILHLPWEECELVGTQQFDVILAADVVYDSSEFDSLVGAIEHLFKLMDDKVALILAATVRNEATLEMFLHLLESRKFVKEVQLVVPEDDSFLFWDRTTPVKIMKITRNANLS